MTDLDLEAIKREHATPETWFCDECQKHHPSRTCLCGQPIPCPILRLVEEVERLRAKVKDYSDCEYHRDWLESREDTVSELAEALQRTREERDICVHNHNVLAGALAAITKERDSARQTIERLEAQNEATSLLLADSIQGRDMAREALKVAREALQRIYRFGQSTQALIAGAALSRLSGEPQEPQK